MTTLARVRSVRFVAPSGFVPDVTTLDRAAAYFAARGWQVQADDAVFERHLRFAGADDLRLASLMQAAQSDAPLVVAVRGGYGLSRLLDHIDWSRVADSGKIFVGSSDFTAFGLALYAHTRAISFHGPMANADFGAPVVSAFTDRHFWQVMENDQVLVEVRANGQPKVDVEGIVWGGNLSMVCALLGTPHFPKIRKGILFLEDVGEQPYAIERMLLQLHQAGVLRQQQAVLLGAFTQYRLSEADNGFDLDAVIDYVRQTAGVPVLTGLPVGHVSDKLTLPIGARCGLTSQRGGYRLYLEGYPTLE